MADSTGIIIERLNNDNYQVWKYKLELLLIREGVWDNVVNTVPAIQTKKWKKGDDKARATIGLLVEDNQLVYIREAKTAHDIWESLRKHHEKSTLTNKVFLLKRICSLKLEESGNMQEHVDTMLNLVHKLAALGEILKDNLVVAMLRVSLPDSYSTLVTELESISEDNLTLEFVKGELIVEYETRKCSSAAHSSNEASMKWYVDSDASSHMVNYREFFKDFEKLNTTVSFAKKEITAKVLGIGTGEIQCLNRNGTQINVKLKDVLYVPSFEKNLISIRKTTENGHHVIFTYKNCEILTNEGESVAVAVGCGNNLYRLSIKEPSCLTTTEENHTKDCQHEWHRKFGHQDMDAIKELVNKDLAAGIRIEDCGMRLTCECCVKGNLASKPFPKASKSTRSKAILDLIHIDVFGPTKTITPGDNRYILTIIDDYSRYSNIYLMKHKGKAGVLIKEFVEFAKNQFQRKPKIIRSDQGREYVNNYLQNYLKKQGIRIQYTFTYFPHQNGVAEEKNRSLVEMVKCMLDDAGMDKKYWGEAVITANYLQNLLPTKYRLKTPYELWYKKKPNVEDLQVFGCKVLAHISKEQRGKMDENAKELTFVGYSSDGYRLLDKNTNTVINTRDLVFMNISGRK